MTTTTFRPDPKPRSHRYRKYTLWIRTLRSCISDKKGRRDDQIVNCHMRCMHGGGTGHKPSDFHQLPALDSEHQFENSGKGGNLLTMMAASIKCLFHVCKYLALHGTEHQIVEAVNRLGDYISEERI